MRIIAIANQKGGVGKTPITVNLGFALARAGYNILFVDFDPQGSLSEYFLADQADIQEITVYNALSDLRALKRIKNTIKDIQESDLNGGLTIWGILPTLYTVTKAHHKDVLQALHDKYGAEVYEEESRDTTKYNDATALKTDVSALDK